jgi:riboflavin kinase/FMN adenylyltransferase
MQLFRGLHHLDAFPKGCVATIGNFDGVHLGHQAILARLRERAAELGVPSCVVIFEPQPREFFLPDIAPVRLTRLREKLECFARLGVDNVLCLNFNRRLRELSAEAFVQQVLVEGLGVKHLEIGDDFRFGCDRAGDFTYLNLAAGPTASRDGCCTARSWRASWAGPRPTSSSSGVDRRCVASIWSAA